MAVHPSAPLICNFGLAGSLDPPCPQDTGAVQVEQPFDGRERAAPWRGHGPRFFIIPDQLLGPFGFRLPFWPWAQ